MHIYRIKFSFINTNKSFNKSKQLEIKYWNHPPIISFYSFPTKNKYLFLMKHIKVTKLGILDSNLLK